MSTRVSNSGYVRRSFQEDPDFDFRFRKNRLRRWWSGIRNGIDPLSLFAFRLGISETIRFCGTDVVQSPNQATYRSIEDIWMRGEYDLPDIIPTKGWRVMEIGGNVGIFAMLAAARGARVETFEPDPCTYARLVKNARRFDIICHNVAIVGSSQDYVRLRRHPLRDTRNSVLGQAVSNDAGALNGRSEVAFSDTIEVSCMTLAQALREPCDLLKVSCEGAEFEIFSAAREELRLAARIAIELHPLLDTPWGNARTLIDKFEGLGFHCRLHSSLPGVSRCFLVATRQPDDT